MVRPRTADFLNFAEARRQARARLPKGLFEYIDRGTEDECALGDNRRAFDRVKIKPYALRSAASRSTGITLFGQQHAAPIVVTPTALGGLVRYHGEIEMACAAAAFGIPYCAATEGITAVEEIADASPEPIWFQLYLWEDEAVSLALMDRIWSKGVRTLLVTVDTPAVPKREFNARNGFDVPFRLSARSAVDVALHPRWLLSVFSRYLVDGGLPKHANYPEPHRHDILHRGGGPSLAYMPDLTWEHMRRLRDHWRGDFVIKGILRLEDALGARDIGADGVVVSNHGGRNLDSAVSPIEVLGDIAEAVGSSLTVLADSSVQRGSDVFKLLACGAKAVLVGRSMLYATAVAGAAGALQMMTILADELATTMDMSGCRSVSEIDRDMLFFAKG